VTAKRTAFTATYALLFAGGVLLVVSVLSSNAIAAFAGLAGFFWGALLLYVANDPYVKVEMIGPSFEGQRAVIRQFMDTAGAGSKAIYLPPRSLGEVSEAKVLFPRAKGQKGSKGSSASSGTSNVGDGLLMPAPGLGLVRYYQEKSDSDFFGVDLQFVKVTLPKLLAENLEVVQAFEMSVDDDKVTVTVVGTRFYELCSSMSDSSESEEKLACPFHSSFAVILARAVGKPITIDSIERMGDHRSIIATYKIEEALP
jgi:hypothetical protein